MTSHGYGPVKDISPILASPQTVVPPWHGVLHNIADWAIKSTTLMIVTGTRTPRYPPTRQFPARQYSCGSKVQVEAAT